jgi:hypothetical protein
VPSSKTPQLCPPSERAQHARPTPTPTPEIAVERSPSAARHSVQVTTGSSDDLTALAACLKGIAKLYRSEDVSQTAYVEMLEQRGSVFLLSDLVAHAKTVWERYRQQERRSKKCLVSLQAPVGDENETITLEDILSNRITAEEMASLHEQLRTLERDEHGQLLVRSTLEGQSLTRTGRKWRTKAASKARKKILRHGPKHRRVVLSSIRRKWAAVW